MKLTKSKLKQIIKEELKKVLQTEGMLDWFQKTEPEEPEIQDLWFKYFPDPGHDREWRDNMRLRVKGQGPFWESGQREEEAIEQLKILQAREREYMMVGQKEEAELSPWSKIFQSMSPEDRREFIRRASEKANMTPGERKRKVEAEEWEERREKERYEPGYADTSKKVPEFISAPYDIEKHSKYNWENLNITGKNDMKLTKTKLKRIIKEELQAAIPDEYTGYQQDYSNYEKDDMGTDRRMVMLLEEILAQLKTLNHYMTPAKGIGASGLEKAAADIAVAESKENNA